MTTEKQRALDIVGKGTEFRRDFPGWILNNWTVFQEFERLCLFAAKRDRPRVSAKFIFGLIRWNTAIREEDGPYKINGNFAPDCALLFERLHPQHKGIFEFRRRVAA